jgi:histidinol-phosphate aminotransferase
MPDQITYLDRNENQYGPAPACFAELAAIQATQLSCYSKDYTRGVKSVLSERIAGMYGVPEKQIMLGYGGEDLLKQSVHCYLEQGETILIPTHSWWYYKSIADEKGGIKVEYPMLPRGDRYVYDVDSLLELHRRHSPRLILISSPNNPTGNTMPFDELRRIMDEVRDSVIVLDEAYWGFTAEPDGYVRELLERNPNMVVIRTFSKLYALAGARIGFAFLGDAMERLSRFSARYLGYNRVTERLALAALDSQDYYADIRDRMLADKHRYYSELGALPGFRVYKSDANFLLADIPADKKETLKSSLKQRGLLVKFFDEPFLENSIRITIGTEEQNLRLIDAIVEIVSDRKPA